MGFLGTHLRIEGLVPGQIGSCLSVLRWGKKEKYGKGRNFGKVWKMMDNDGFGKNYGKLWKNIDLENGRAGWVG